MAATTARIAVLEAQVASHAAQIASHAAQIAELRALLAAPSPATPVKGKKAPKEPGAPRKATNPTGPAAYNEMVWAVRQELATKAGVAAYATFLAAAGDEKKAREAFNAAAKKAGVDYKVALNIAAARKAAAEGTERKPKAAKVSAAPTPAAASPEGSVSGSEDDDDTATAASEDDDDTATAASEDEADAVLPQRGGGGARPPRERVMGDIEAPEGFTIVTLEDVDYLESIGDGDLYKIDVTQPGIQGEYAGHHIRDTDDYEMV